MLQGATEQTTRTPVWILSTILWNVGWSDKIKHFQSDYDYLDK